MRTGIVIKIAQRISRCSLCDEYIQEGDPIVLWDEHEWVHQDCGENALLGLDDGYQPEMDRGG